MTTTATHTVLPLAGQAVQSANGYAATGFDPIRPPAGYGYNEHGVYQYPTPPTGAAYAAPQSDAQYAIGHAAPQADAWSRFGQLEQAESIPFAGDPGFSPQAAAPARFHIDQRRYWVGAVLTAGVAVLVAVLGMLIAKGVFHESIIVRNGDGSFAVHVGAYALFTGLISLLTSVLFLGISQFAPRPGLYFAWIGALGVLFAAVLPFTMSLTLVSQVIFAAINVLVGVAIVTLVPVSAHSSVVRP